jgi:hypothetical protein
MSISYPAAILYVATLGEAAAVSSSEAASLKGKKALTPIISGSICGGLMFLAWTIGFTIYFRKRYKRRERHRLVAAGKATPKETDLDIPQETIIIPPDPAVLLGQGNPGEFIIPKSHSSGYKFRQLLPWSDHGPHQEKPRDKAIVNISSPLEDVHTVPKTKEEDAIVDEMTVPMTSNM